MISLVLISIRFFDCLLIRMWTNVLLPLSLLRHKPWMLVLLQTSFHVMVCRSDQHLIYLRSQKMKSAINLGSTRLPSQSCWLVAEKGWESSKRLLKLSQKRPVLLPSDHMCATSFAYRDRILLVEWLSSEVIFFTSIDHNMWSEY